MIEPSASAVEPLTGAAAALRSARSVVALTGAGIAAESVLRGPADSVLPALEERV